MLEAIANNPAAPILEVLIIAALIGIYIFLLVIEEKYK